MHFSFDSKVIKNSLFALYFVVAVAAAMQAWFSPPKIFFAGGQSYTEYNNYMIFKYSSVHLQEDKDLYKQYPDAYWDLYKYSPTFALLFTPFALMPDYAGLLLWDLLNILTFFVAVIYLPKITDKQKGVLLLLVLLEVITSVQNEQSNLLMTGLLLLTFGFLERKKLLLATLVLSLTLFIKLYGVLAIILFLFYPHKWKAAAYTLLSMILLFLLPLTVTGWHHLLFLYQSWGHLLVHDVSISAGLSVAGWLSSWFNLQPEKYLLIAAGALLSALPLLRINQYNQFIFRILTLALLLVWMVIFNPKAESPTYIIAITGVALWFVISPKNGINILLLVLALVLTSLSPTDLFPHTVRTEYFVPYVVKAVPCILIWIKILVDMVFLKKEGEKNDLIIQ